MTVEDGLQQKIESVEPELQKVRALYSKVQWKMATLYLHLVNYTELLIITRENEKQAVSTEKDV